MDVMMRMIKMVVQMTALKALTMEAWKVDS
jgi:hypothetical protein